MALIPEPRVLETHGGYGVIYQRCYSGLPSGVVIEKNIERAALLSRQRPHWLVYEGACEVVLRAAAGDLLGINFLDLDPYGEAWTAIDSFFAAARSFPSVFGIVVNDGLRQGLQRGGAWKISVVQKMVQKYGNDEMAARYLEICKEMLVARVAEVGYQLTHWAGYHCGLNDQMTHYAAVLKQ